VLDPLLQQTLALALAALFGAAVIHKLVAMREWPGIVHSYALLPNVLVLPVAAALIGAEALAAVALMLPKLRPLGGALAGALLALYAAALSINLWRGRTSIDCGCFAGRLRHGIAPWMVARNLVLGALALTLLLPASARPTTLTDDAVAVVCALTLAFLYPVLTVAARPPPPTFDQNYRITSGGSTTR